ncbi:MAG: hypothetical protein LBL66_10625 [Clostridiales bacterium]|jgi:hypothetical protein|nr:hypothetical protein [Clostridiales bacterium]
MKKVLTVSVLLIAACAAALFSACGKKEVVLTVAEVKQAYTDAQFTAADSAGVGASKLLGALAVTKGGDAALIYVFEDAAAANAFTDSLDIAASYQNAVITGFSAGGALLSNLDDAKVVALRKPLSDLWDGKNK